MGVSRDCPNVLGTPLLSQEWVKLRTSNFVGTFIESIGTKAHENVGNSGRGRSQAVPKIFMAPVCRAHCAVIYAIAQLSCLLHSTYLLNLVQLKIAPLDPLTRKSYFVTEHGVNRMIRCGDIAI